LRLRLSADQRLLAADDFGNRAAADDVAHGFLGSRTEISLLVSFSLFLDFEKNSLIFRSGYIDYGGPLDAPTGVCLQDTLVKSATAEIIFRKRARLTGRLD
jgi:hypothetical protein